MKIYCRARVFAPLRDTTTDYNTLLKPIIVSVTGYFIKAPCVISFIQRSLGVRGPRQDAARRDAPPGWEAYITGARRRFAVSRRGSTGL